MKPFNFFLLFFLTTCFNQNALASLICDGSAFGLKYTYVFTKTNNKSLELNQKAFSGSDLLLELSGVAEYSSTVKVRGNIDESYYVFAESSDSYSELISISRDMKNMASSRPMPNIDSANYIRLKCKGVL